MSGDNMGSSSSCSPTNKSHRNKEVDYDEFHSLREEDDLIIIPEERSETFQIDDDSAANQGRWHSLSQQSSKSSRQSTKPLTYSPGTRRNRVGMQAPHSAPTSKKRSARASSGRMLLTPLDTKRSLTGVPEGMVDFSEAAEHEDLEDLSNNSFSSSGWGSWNKGWNDEPSGPEDASLKRAKLRVDEAFLQYTIVEKAALRLQQSFRSKRNDRLLADTPLKDGSNSTDDDSDDLKKESEEDQATDRSSWYTLLFLGLFGVVQVLFTFVKSCCGSSNTEGLDPNVVPVDGAANAAPAGNGGGGGGGAPPPGLEAMAGQAAGAASSSAGAGASAGAAAGEFMNRV